jgi:predicted MFS family arabinose efflux permease
MFIVDWRLAFCLLAPVALALMFALWSGLLARYNKATKEMAENLIILTNFAGIPEGIGFSGIPAP